MAGDQWRGDPQGVSIAPGQDQASRDPSCHVSRGREIHQLGWGCAAGSGVSMSQGSERQQEVEREQREIKEWPLHTAQVMRC